MGGWVATSAYSLLLVVKAPRIKEEAVELYWNIYFRHSTNTIENGISRVIISSGEAVVGRSDRRYVVHTCKKVGVAGGGGGKPFGQGGLGGRRLKESGWYGGGGQKEKCPKFFFGSSIFGLLFNKFFAAPLARQGGGLGGGSRLQNFFLLGRHV